MIFIFLQILAAIAQDECDMEFDEALCSARGTPMIGQSFMPSLKILLGFEDADIINQGPTMLDDKFSGLFQGQWITMTQESDPYFTYTMWLFFPRQSGADKPRTVCPIMHKGQEGENYPDLSFDQKQRLINILVDQTVTPEESLLSSVGRIQYNQWVHISLICTNTKIKLYVNGILDNLKIFQSSPKGNSGSLYIGNVPWLKDSCAMSFLLDKFQYYNEEIKTYFLQSQAQIALQVEQASIHFGCINCNNLEAAGACISGYHICTSLEISSGIYAVARQQGWLDWGDYIWTYEALAEEHSGLAVCCIN